MSLFETSVTTSEGHIYGVAYEQKNDVAIISYVCSVVI
jgi:hypothetical protein